MVRIRLITLNSIMKKLLSLIAVSQVLTSCCPCRVLTSSATDSIRIETVVRTEFVKDTVYIDVLQEVVREISADSSHLETEYARSDARILADGQLFHLLENKAQKRPVEIQKVIEYRDSIVWKERTAREVVEVEKLLTAWQRLQMTGFWVFVTAIVVAMGLWIRKKLY